MATSWARITYGMMSMVLVRCLVNNNIINRGRGLTQFNLVADGGAVGIWY